MSISVASVHELAVGVGSNGTLLGGVIGGIIFAIICNRVADAKGRGVVMWTILGFFFSLISLIVLAILPRKK
jgi:hypothetical protein